MAVTDFTKEMAVAVFTNKRERLTVWGEKIRRFAERLTPYNRAPKVAVCWMSNKLYNLYYNIIYETYRVKNISLIQGL